MVFFLVRVALFISLFVFNLHQKCRTTACSRCLPCPLAPKYQLLCVNMGEGHLAGAWPAAAAADLDTLIAAVARGEHGAFDSVFRQLSGPVWALALAVVRDPAQAEEVAQEVFTEMWQLASRYDRAKGSAVTWALMITRRRAIDRIRSVSADVSRQLRAVIPPMPWDQVGEAAEEISDREQLRCCLGQLSGPQHQAITLAFYGGRTYADVAIAQGVAEGTAKSRIRDALIKLRECMQARVKLRIA